MLIVISHQAINDWLSNRFFNVIIMKTLGQIEEEISAALTEFEKNFWAKGPRLIKTIIADDCIIVYININNSLANENMQDDSRMLDGLYRNAILSQKNNICASVEQIIKAQIAEFFCDVDCSAKAKVYVFKMKEKFVFRQAANNHSKVAVAL